MSENVLKRVYCFGGGNTEGNLEMADLLGGKGVAVADLCKAGLSVPPGFTITTDTCAEFHFYGGRMPLGLMTEVCQNLSRIEEMTQKQFGGSSHPLLLSVRPGAKLSMPGMMDTVLNIGLNDAVVEGLAQLSNNPRFAYDSYCRLINMFGDTVMGVDHEHFEQQLSQVKMARNVKLDTDLSTDDLKEVVERYKKVYREHVGSEFPNDPYVQLAHAIEAVFKSWMGDRAIRYRELNDIRGLRGTAVNVQSMVYGNMGDDCATGVAFTRNPATGENKFYGEFLINAQGEDVVAGIRTPIPCEEMPKYLPKSAVDLMKAKDLLEGRYRDMLDLEFTVERDHLYILQTRKAKRTDLASIRVALDLLDEGVIDEETAVRRVDSGAVDRVSRPQVDWKVQRIILARGLPASFGGACGKIAFTATEAEERTSAGEKVILAKQETEPGDILGIRVAEGLVTASGGMTSHGAVGARRMEKPAVTGAGVLKIDKKSRTISVADKVFGSTDWITIDGATGDIMEGQIPLLPGEFNPYVKRLKELASRFAPHRGDLHVTNRGRVSDPSIPLFYSYSHRDERLRDELEKHLSILKRQGVIAGWHDRQLEAGTKWEEDLLNHLHSAEIILLLISADFIASDYCYGKELDIAMQRHAQGSATVIPIILRPVDWDNTPFARLQALPKDGKPITTWTNADEAFSDVARGIRAVAARRRSGQKT